jgi:hypothetical protein
MADKMKVPFNNPDGSISQEIGTIMEVTDAKEPWSEYNLEDGTKIRMKPTLINITRLEGKTAPNGDQIYSIQLQQKMSVFPNI